MNRVIKFRGKEFPKKNWIFASAYDQENEIFIIDYANYAVIDETVGEFTGFKDIDGNEIFEGDILQYVDHPDEKAKYVKMLDGSWVIGNKVFDDLATALIFADFKVIGNIHDNKELLEGGKVDDD